MHIAKLLVTTALLLQGCGPRGATETKVGGTDADRPSAAPHWDLQSNRDGVALAIWDKSGAAALRLFCPAGQNQILVNVPSFKPIGSEERLSFGSGGNVVALVADSSGDAQRGGVSGSGPVPDDLKGLISGPVSASYGAQRSGPHPAHHRKWPARSSRPALTMPALRSRPRRSRLHRPARASSRMVICCG